MTAMAAVMKIAVAAIERGDNRAMPQTPCPDVQPLLNRVPKPTKSPPTAITVRTRRHLRKRERQAEQHGSKRRGDQTGDEGGAPGAVAAGRIDQSGEDAGDTGDPAVEHHQKNRREPDQRAADGGGDGVKLAIVIASNVKPTAAIWRRPQATKQ